MYKTHYSTRLPRGWKLFLCLLSFLVPTVYAIAMEWQQPALVHDACYTGYAHNLIDGDVSTTWHHWTEEEHYIVLDFGDTHKIGGVRIWHERVWDREYALAGVYVSDDAQNWSESLGSLPEIYYVDPGWKEVVFTTPVEGRYIKLVTALCRTPYWREAEILAELVIDETPPATTTDLTVTATTDTSISLGWIAPGDDDRDGRAASYEIRYSETLITEENWETATLVQDSLTPALVAGTAENFEITGLSSATIYYAALRSSDEKGNISGLSNIIGATTEMSPPENLSVSVSADLTEDTLTLSWIEADPVPAGKTYFDSQSGLCWIGDSPATTSELISHTVTVNGLDPETGHSWTVATSDTLGHNFPDQTGTINPGNNPDPDDGTGDSDPDTDPNPVEEPDPVAEGEWRSPEQVISACFDRWSENIVDGDVATVWNHWEEENHEIVVDMGQPGLISKISMWHRQRNDAVRAIEAIYISETLDDWGEPAGSFPRLQLEDAGWFEGDITPRTGRFIKLVSEFSGTINWYEVEFFGTFDLPAGTILPIEGTDDGSGDSGTDTDAGDETGTPPVSTDFPHIDRDNILEVDPENLPATGTFGLYNLTVEAENGEVSTDGFYTTANTGNQVVQLIAEADPGYRFVSWSTTNGADTLLSESNPLAVLLGSDQEITAHFELNDTVITLTTAPGTDIYSDLKDAVDSLAQSGGGTIYLPAGEFLLSRQVNMIGGISIIGQGMEETVILGVDQCNGFLQINYNAEAGDPMRISSLTFDGYDEVNDFTAQNGIFLRSIPNFRIDNCHILGCKYLVSAGASTFNRHPIDILPAKGVVDHCIIEQGDTPYSSCYGVTTGLKPWRENMQLGTENAVFIEDCIFRGCSHSADSFGGGHYVFRHNTVWEPNGTLGGHGPGFDDSGRGTRCVEIYENTFFSNYDPEDSSRQGRQWAAIGPRGGGGVIFNNTMEYFQYGIKFICDTSSIGRKRGEPCTLCDNPDCFSAGETGAPGDPDVYRYDAAAYRCEYWSTDHRYYIMDIPFEYPALDQIHDMYIWGNEYTNVDHGNMVYVEPGNYSQTLIQEGRDFHRRQPALEVDGFNYTPYPYPHHLVTSDDIPLIQPEKIRDPGFDYQADGAVVTDPADPQNMITAASGNFEDLQAAIEVVTNLGGGTVFIPEGTFYWGTGEDYLTIPGGTNIIGKGYDKTFIVANSTKAAMFNINKFAVDCRPVRISGIAFSGWTEDADFSYSKFAIVLGNIPDFRIDHCYFNGFSYVMSLGSLEGYPLTRGVIDHCYFDNTNNYCNAAYGTSVGAPWDGDERLTNAGTENAIFIEDNLFTDYGHPTASFGGGHYVARHNVFLRVNDVPAFPLDGHGPGFESSGRGTRCMEIYDNLMVNMVEEDILMWRAITPRAGGGMVFNNTVCNFRHMLIFTTDSRGEVEYPALDQIHDYYIWDNNLVNITEDPIWIYGEIANAIIEENRDYFQRAPSMELDGFEYTPYVYPHPRTLDDSYTLPDPRYIYPGFDENWDDPDAGSGDDDDTGGSDDTGTDPDTGNNPEPDPVDDSINNDGVNPTANEGHMEVYVDWSEAGYSGDIPALSANRVNVLENGLVAGGLTDNATALQTLINSVTTPAQLYFPEGIYRFESGVSIDRSGIVLQGDGSEKSVLTFLTVENCLDIEGGSVGTYAAMPVGASQNATVIEVADASRFTIGQGVAIRQDDIVPPEADWGANAVGQMLRITAIDGNQLTIEPPLNLGYPEGNNPVAAPVNYVSDVGIEDLTIQRLDSGLNYDSGNNIDFQRAANCWMRRVESNNTEKYHVGVSESVFVEIRDSYIHHAKFKADGGQGYGVSLAHRATAVLVENNIFHELRHSMILQIGVNGCVFGYNYAESNYSDDGWDKTYISLHGHYPYMNLFEGNIIGWIGAGDYWGPIGPGNTFFRNRLKSTAEHVGESRENRGIWLRYVHGVQNVVGNEFTSGDIYYYDSTTVYEAVNYGDEQARAFIHGNNVLGTVTWNPEVTDQYLPDSLYLPEKPAFYGNDTWPSLGGDKIVGTGVIPAQVRWINAQHVNQP